MNSSLSLFSPSSSSSLLLLPHVSSSSSIHHSFPPRLYYHRRHNLSSRLFHSLKCSSSSESTIEVLNLEVEKDWSFLDIDNLNSLEQQTHKSNRIISAADIKPTSRVLVSFGTEDFIDKLVLQSSPCQLLLVVHDSLFSLAMIKEKYDSIKCWQGDIIHVPDKWVPFDVVFLTFLPALPFQLTQIFGALAQRCSPGAKVIISHPQGRGGLEEQQKEFPDVVTSDLPDKPTLDKVASDYHLDLTEFVDETGFYLAVLEFSGKGFPAR